MHPLFTPNRPVERTRLLVTVHAPAASAPATFPHGPRRSGVSLTLFSFGDFARAP